MCALSLCPRELDSGVTVMSLGGYVCVTLLCVGYAGVSHHVAGRGGCRLVPHLPMWWGDAARAVAGALYVAEQRYVLLCCLWLGCAFPGCAVVYPGESKHPWCVCLCVCL